MLKLCLITLLGVWIQMSNLSIDNELNIKLIKKLSYEVYKDNKVLADLTTAQAILEAGLLQKVPSSLAFKYNNLFGIKGRGTKGSITLKTKEFSKQKGNYQTTAMFAWNKTVEDSLEQRKRLFQTGTRKTPNNYFKVLSAQTFEEAAKALVTAPEPYATDPKYAEKLISIYKEYIQEK